MYYLHHCSLHHAQYLTTAQKHSQMPQSSADWCCLWLAESVIAMPVKMHRNNQAIAQNQSRVFLYRKKSWKLNNDCANKIKLANNIY